jgi:AraC-like DNA-binding protein
MQERVYWLKEGQAAQRQYRYRFRLFGETGPLAFGDRVDIRRNAWELVPLLEQVCDESARPTEYGEHRLRSLTVQLAIAFMALPLRDRECRVQLLSRVQRERVGHQIARWLEVESPEDRERLTPQALADHVGLTLDYFSRVFRNTYGLAPQSFVKRERMRYVANLMQSTPLSIKEIGNRIGIRDSSLLCRQFRQVFGCSPRQFRKQGEKAVQLASMDRLSHS